MSYHFTSAKQLLALCAETGQPMSALMRAREGELFGSNYREQTARMQQAWQIMQDSCRQPIQTPRPSMGGIIGGEAQRLAQTAAAEEAAAREPLSGPVLSLAARYAMAVLEVNASMGLIVAAPTAGAAGVIPGAFLAVQETRGLSNEQMINALFTAGAVGLLIMTEGSVSGAEGGCQAETGSAAAMAAAGLVEILGGSPEAALGASSTCLQNVLGLVCDPVGGLVEAPCQRSNALGAANALIAAEMGLAGLGGVIPLDEMIVAARKVGQGLPVELRETGLGGTAATPTACELCGGC